MGFDLLIQHSASKREWVVSGLTDKGNTMAYVFKDFVMPEDAPEGEYYCVLVWNGREDVEWDVKDVLLDSVARTSEGNVMLRNLRPEIFLMRYGVVESPAQYRDTDKQYYYYNK